jgi:DNA-binding protein HU-beta
MAGIGDIAKAGGVKYEAVSATIEGIRKLLMQGEKITLQDFGTFYIDVQDKKKARKVATKEEINVPEKSVPKFRFNYTFKSKIAEDVAVDKEKLNKKRDRKAKYDAKMAEKAGVVKTPVKGKK